MFVFKILTIAAGVAALAMTGYLGKILNDSSFLDQVAQIPKEDVMMYHIVAVVVILWLLVSFFMKLVSRAIVVVLLVLAVGAEGMFLGLNVSGLIEIEPESLQEQIKDQLQDKAGDLLEDLKDKIDN